jgi:hypothetical protein
MSNSEFNISQEVWKAIPGYPGYEVSDHGRVRSYWRKGHYSISSKLTDSVQKIMNLTPCPSGHLHLRLCRNNKALTMRVHRLVLLAFIGPCPDGMQACHNDGNPSNNYLNNLRWDTQSSNQLDSLKHGTKPLGMNHKNSKLTDKDIKEIRRLFDEGFPRTSISFAFNICVRLVYRIANREVWVHIH